MFKATPAGCLFFPNRGSFHSHSQWFTWHIVFTETIVLAKGKNRQKCILNEMGKKKQLSMTSFP